ncbi:MAG TPA: AAA family ATPase, partial [Armatimonadaceae bacterium]|nr:AAA family ATPase [Armatimonadaceae bacterium]
SPPPRAEPEGMGSTGTAGTERGGWRIEMLGGLRVRCRDRTLARFPSRKAAALLAYLALNPGRFHARDALAEMLWPDAPRASQLHNLRLTLSRLRGMLAPDDALLDADRLAVRLDPDAFTTDVAEFEDAVARKDPDAARALYAGPLLPGLNEEWVLLPQARLEALREQLDEGREAAAAAAATACPEPRRLPETLPLPLTRFFGRDRELAALAVLLGESRLVTLTGAGGTGKTRLAIEAARTPHPDRRAAFVSLADLTDAAQAPEAVRGTLRLPAPAPGFCLTELVRRELAALSPLLLVLDNAEHLLARRSLADFVLGLLTEAPGLTVLVASRRALEIPGEVVVPVGPLSMEARTALFVDRARSARPGFQETPATLATVRDICRRLEGLPLALELAAARASVLSVREILDSVARRLDFLAARPHAGGVTRRHRSLRAAIRSGDRRSKPELQERFARLSAFRGGFTADAAAAVAGARLDTLDELMRWSLLHPEEQPDGSLRFRMPETLRDFGQECLAESDLRALSRQHARFFCEWSEENRADDANGSAPDPATRRAWQDAEQDNVRAALTFCRKSRRASDREIGLRLVAAFWTFWFVRNAGAEMEEWATALLTPDAAEPGVAPLVRARAQLALGLAVRERGEIDRFAALAEEARAVLEGGPHDRHLAFARHLHGLAWADRRCFADAAAAYAGAESLWERLGDARNHAVTRHNRALLALERGDHDEAERLIEPALAEFRRGGEVSWTAIALLTRAGVRAGRGDFAGASAACAESTALYLPLGYARGEAQARRDWCRYLAARGEWDEAAEQGERALALFRQVGDRHGEATALLILADVAAAAVERSSRARVYLAEAARLQERHQWPSVAPLLARVAAGLAAD